jgi:hypothetical protein
LYCHIPTDCIRTVDYTCRYDARTRKRVRTLKFCCVEGRTEGRKDGREGGREEGREGGAGRQEGKKNGRTEERKEGRKEARRICQNVKIKIYQNELYKYT